jgi:hypothetical protein
MGGFTSNGLRVMIVLGFHSLRHSAASLKGASDTERPLSARAAMMSIVTLSMIGWTSVLMPLWTITQ